MGAFKSWTALSLLTFASLAPAAAHSNAHQTAGPKDETALVQGRLEIMRRSVENTLLPDGWESATDPRTGLEYFWPSSDRNAVTWERPTEAPPAGEAPLHPLEIKDSMCEERAFDLAAKLERSEQELKKVSNDKLAFNQDIVASLKGNLKECQAAQKDHEAQCAQKQKEQEAQCQMSREEEFRNCTARVERATQPLKEVLDRTESQLRAKDAELRSTGNCVEELARHKSDSADRAAALETQKREHSQCREELRKAKADAPPRSEQSENCEARLQDSERRVADLLRQKQEASSEESRLQAPAVFQKKWLAAEERAKAAELKSRQLEEQILALQQGRSETSGEAASAEVRFRQRVSELEEELERQRGLNAAHMRRWMASEERIEMLMEELRSGPEDIIPDGPFHAHAAAPAPEEVHIVATPKQPRKLAHHAQPAQHAQHAQAVPPPAAPVQAAPAKATPATTAPPAAPVQAAPVQVTTAPPAAPAVPVPEAAKPAAQPDDEIVSVKLPDDGFKPVHKPARNAAPVHKQQPQQKAQQHRLRAAPEHETKHEETKAAPATKAAAAKTPVAKAKAAAEPSKQLPPGWRQVWSERDHGYYYWHVASGNTTWDFPTKP